MEHRIDEFILMQFGIKPTDPMFNCQVDLFEARYVDSLGIIELLEFLRGESSFEILKTSLPTTSPALRV
jgi:hypothetical protein